MLKHNDYLEAIRRFKNKKENAHARQRYHALLLVTKGYGFRETADILFLDEETVSRWVQSYQQQGLDGLKNNPLWGGEHGQRQLNDAELATLSSRLETTAMPGTRVGSGWTLKAIYDLVVEQFAVFYSRRGLRKLLRALGWSYQRGRKLYIRRSADEQARFEMETREILAEFAKNGATVTPLAGDETKVYLEASLARRWNPVGQQPVIADAARAKKS